jgi:MFS transporter, ACS family, hexuronate transporter
VEDLVDAEGLAPDRVRDGRGPWQLLSLALVAQVGFSVVEQGIPTLTGFVKLDLGVSAFVAGLAVSSVMFGKIFGSYAAGIVADRMGERRVLMFGAFAAATLIALAMLSPLPILFPLLVVAGVAGAAASPAGGRLVLLAFPPARRGIALGIRQTGIPLGGLIAAGLLPWIARDDGWRWSLAIAGGITAAAALPLAIFGRGSTDGVVHRTTHHVSPARNRNLRLLTIWGCLLVTGQFAVVSFLALDLHRGAHLSLASASLLVAVAQATGILGRVLWGAVSDRALPRGRKPLLLVLTAAALVSSLALFATPRSAPIAVLVAVAGLAGLALVGYQGLWFTMVAEVAGPARVGASTGFAVTFVAAAGALTPPLYGLVADLTGTYRAIWAALSILLALAFVPALLLEEP